MSQLTSGQTCQSVCESRKETSLDTEIWQLTQYLYSISLSLSFDFSAFHLKMHNSFNFNTIYFSHLMTLHFWHKQIISLPVAFTQMFTLRKTCKHINRCSLSVGLKRLKVKGRFMGLFQHCGHSAYCILTPNKFPHSSPEAPRIIQMRETSTSEGGNYYQWILLANT